MLVEMLVGSLGFDDVPVRAGMRELRSSNVDSQSVQKRSDRPRDVW